MRALPLAKFLMLSCILCLTLPLSAKELTNAEKFQAAEKALRYNKMGEYYRLKKELNASDYVLYPYLQYAEIQKLMAQPDLPITAVRGFLQQEQDSALGDRLRTTWLNHLAKKRKWSTFVADYQPSDNIALQCYYIYAQYQTTQQKATLNQARELWTYGKSRPKECDVLFDTWRSQGDFSAQDAWNRIELAADKHQYALVNYLKRFVPDDEQVMVDTWLSVYKSPTLVTSDKLFKGDHSFLRDTQVYGITKIARSNPEKALKTWDAIEAKYPFTDAQRHQVYRAIALHYAMDHDDRAHAFFEQIPETAYDKTLYEWRVRSYLRDEDWKQVKITIDLMPEALKNEPTWQYWLARASEQTGNKNEAKAIYAKLVNERDFHGIMASDRTRQDYALTLPEATVAQVDIDAVMKDKRIQRALALRELGRIYDARREWSYATQQFNESQLQAAAIIAYENQWYDRAILTLARADNKNNTTIRFPVAFQKTIEREAKRQGLNPSWVYAIARRESAFIPDARSSAGAVGLMQVMPYTAKQIAKEISEPYISSKQLTDLDKNVRLGSAYLHKMYNELDENIVLATAAYNAGPHRVKKWLPKRGRVEADIWIETMPFYETREYVKAVLAYRMIYQNHLNKPERLSETLKDVRAR